MEPVNESDIDWTVRDGVEGTFKQKRLGAAAGSDALGCSLYELPPGAQPWSYHYHAANEEALYVLSGRGQVRLGGEVHALAEGDYVPCPSDESGAHCVVNDGDEPLRYLAVSTMNDPDVTIHPDIDKVGVYVGAPPGSSAERTVSAFYDHEFDGDEFDGDD
ncbi:cupin domain-containing protein [Haloferax sp. AB510]|uniref:cupin domain-containing protein n=1 Tax=Haloferax sp. AB510 TaxID=2934172 RepID=UPI00209C6CDC|nr:cupin domain-containing protein [Haloferax sp. AB510]MCO8265794.1 cupin domain-containing protein [Haloferax sp. AB510]